MKILIKNATILDVEKENTYNSDLLIEENKITKIEENIKDTVDEIIDATGKLVMPGLINAHCHLAMSLFRGYGENKALMDWLNNYIFPKEENLTDELVYYFTLLSCIEAIKSGTTYVLDMYFYPNSVLDAYRNIGIRGGIGSGRLFENSDDKNIIDYVKENNMEDMVDIYCDPHAPYTVEKEIYANHVKSAKEYNIGIQTHLAETIDEINIMEQRYGKTPVEYLADAGVFEVPIVLAHGIYLNDNDIEILKNAKCGIIHNPVSNAKLASGICDVRKLIDSGILVGLGTDGASSTTTLDMFEEMRLCAYLQKLKYMDPSIVDSFEILKMATLNNAKILGKDKDIGSIQIGKKADLIILDLDKIYFKPNLDIASLLIYAANGDCVDTSIINGKIVMKDREILTINEKEIIEKCDKLVKEFYKEDK